MRKERAFALNEPWDSTAIGWKIYELARLVYFASLRLAARSAAAPADRAEDDKYESASVLTTVIIIYIIINILLIIITENEFDLSTLLHCFCRTTIQCYREVLVDCFIVFITQENMTVKAAKFQLAIERDDW